MLYLMGYAIHFGILELKLFGEVHHLLFFLKDNEEPHAANITKSLLWKKKVVVLDWHSSSYDPIRYFEM